MASRSDLHLLTSPVQIESPINKTADSNSASADLKGYESAEVLVLVGTTGDTLSGSVNWSLELEESDDNSTFTDVAAADLIGGNGGSSGQFALIDDNAEDDTLVKVAYVGTKRYIRVVFNATGTHTNGTEFGAVVVRGKARHSGGQAV